VNQMMTRIDNLKANSDTSCDKTRRLTKRCKPETNTKKSAKGDYSVDPFPISRARQPQVQIYRCVFIFSGERSNKKSSKQ